MAWREGKITSDDAWRRVTCLKRLAVLLLQIDEASSTLLTPSSELLSAQPWQPVLATANSPTFGLPTSTLMPGPCMFGQARAEKGDISS
jgi:hypothetical protein